MFFQRTRADVIIVRRHQRHEKPKQENGMCSQHRTRIDSAHWPRSTLTRTHSRNAPLSLDACVIFFNRVLCTQERGIPAKDPPAGKWRAPYTFIPLKQSRPCPWIGRRAFALLPPSWVTSLAERSEWAMYEDGKYERERLFIARMG